MKKTKKTDEDKVENNDRRGQRERRKVLKAENSSRRDFVSWMTLLLAHSNAMFLQTGHKISAFAEQQQQQQQKQTFTQRFPTLFKPFLGEGTKKTIKTTLVEDRCWALEQTIELGPLETPLRCVVVRLSSGDLWVHNPLAPTEEFFQLVESCAADGGEYAPSSLSASSSSSARVASIVVPTYALEHKVFARDAHEK
ncbi:unnamed protein product [Bathycoccus prasinos]